MKRVIVYVVLSAFFMAGCSEGDHAASPDQPQVEYASPETASVEIQNFMNADWLYDEYFGEYGFPEEFKATVINEIKLVANGFALQYAKGEDVEGSIAEFRSGMLLLQVSGQFGAMISQMSETWYSGDYEAMSARPPAVDMDSLPDAVRYFDLGVSAEEEIARLKALEVETAKDDAVFLKAQEKLVEKYNLPYELPGRAPKYIIYSSSMKGGGGKDKKKDEKPEYKHESDISDWAWRPGDIIWSDGGAGFGHMGIVTHFNNTEGEIARGALPWSWSRPGGAWLSIVDANTGGVNLHQGALLMDAWQKKYDTVRRYTYAHSIGWPNFTPPCDYKDCSQSGKNYYNYVTQRMFAIVNWAMGQVNKPYNWNFFNKNADDRTYCSQLVWQAYRQTARPGSSRPEWRDIDLDSNGGWVVFPNDILNHTLVVKMAESKKKKVGTCQYFCF